VVGPGNGAGGGEEDATARKTLGTVGVEVAILLAEQLFVDLPTALDHAPSESQHWDDAVDTAFRFLYDRGLSD